MEEHDHHAQTSVALAHEPSPAGLIYSGRVVGVDHSDRLTSVEAITRHRELFGYDLIGELQNVVRSIMNATPPCNCKIVLSSSSYTSDKKTVGPSSSSAPPGPHPTTAAAAASATGCDRENGGGHATTTIIHASPKKEYAEDEEEEESRQGNAAAMRWLGSHCPLKHIPHSHAAIAFLMERGFVQYEVGGEVSLQLPHVPSEGSRERELFLQEWTVALAQLRWAAECNTSLISVRLGKLVLLRRLTGEYRIRLHLEWCDEIGVQQRQEVLTSYRDAEMGAVPVAGGSLSAAANAGRGGGGGGGDFDRSSLEDSYDGSEDGLHANTTTSSSECSPARGGGGSHDHQHKQASSSLHESEERAPKSPTVGEKLGNLANAVSSLFGPPASSSAAVVVHPHPPPQPVAMYRYTDSWEPQATRCDQACDISIEVMRKRPLIMDKIEAFGFVHYRNFGVQKFEVDLRDPDRPGGLPIGRITLVVSSLNHQCFALEERKRETKRTVMTAEARSRELEREREQRNLRRFNSDDGGGGGDTAATMFCGLGEEGRSSFNAATILTDAPLDIAGGSLSFGSDGSGPGSFVIVARSSTHPQAEPDAIGVAGISTGDAGDEHQHLAANTVVASSSPHEAGRIVLRTPTSDSGDGGVYDEDSYF